MQITESIVDDIITLANDASALLHNYFSAALTVSFKEDKSPVTKADTDANQLIVERLFRITPTIPIIAEESCNSAEIPPRFWLVDPLDGTRAFVKGVPEFSVNIGLIENNAPMFGVLAIPMRNEIYVGGTTITAQKISADGARKKIHTRTPSIDGLHVVKSASHPSQKMQAYLDTLNISKVEGLSSALKFALLAEGSADIYPRFGRTMEWDTAAGQAILEAAGGSICTADGNPFLYGKPNYENEGFIARGWKGC
jgi:3'(2'), 5'-bisphosphate nucleotidase